MTATRHLISGLATISLAIVLVDGVAGASPDPAAWSKHWSFQKLERPEVPAKGNPVDVFIQKKLAKLGLKQNSRADRYTLIRRATLDLTGLPPTRAEIDDFVRDPSSEALAWQKLVDRLLASPHYGERWGRHWLDVARYVQGTIKVPGIDQIDLAESYRDYVVRSCNEDKPWDQFITEQLAGDLLPVPAGNRKRYFDQIIAPAFLSIGPWFDECTDPNKLRLDIIDEQLSTLSKTFLALNFGCARCHDHKFDPVSTRDYYALAGIMRSTRITEKFSESWRDGRPRLTASLAMPEELAKNQQWQAAIAQKLKKRREFLKRARERIVHDYSAKVAGVPRQTPLARVEAENFAGQKNLKISEDGQSILTRRALDQWVKYNIRLAESGKFPVYIRYSSPDSTPVQMEINGVTQPVEILGSPTGGDDSAHYRWEKCGPYSLKKGNNPIRLKVPRHRSFPRLDVLEIVRDWAGEAQEPLLNRVRQSADFWPISVADAELFLNESERSVLGKIDEEIESDRARVVKYPVVLTVKDEVKKVDLPVHVGGNVHQTEGKPVPRGVPTFGGIILPVPKNESGRLELARWLTHPDNPLTARVLANRIWHWHFGRGIVRTTDDFGMQGADPTNLDLLNWLACELVGSGWSVKHIQRLMMLSNTYQISSETTAKNRRVDPDGSLFSRYPKRRLEVEAIYDSLLSSIGKVPRQKSGTPLDTSKSKDRALYILTSSRSPMGLGIEIRKMFPLFGFDPSGRPIYERDDSATPNQALWWLNNPLPRYYAENLAERLMKEFPKEDDRIRAVFEMTLGRPPAPRENAGIRSYLKNGTTELKITEKEAWMRACLGLFSSRKFSTLE